MRQEKNHLNFRLSQLTAIPLMNCQFLITKFILAIKITLTVSRKICFIRRVGEYVEKCENANEKYVESCNIYWLTMLVIAIVRQELLMLL